VNEYGPHSNSGNLPLPAKDATQQYIEHEQVKSAITEHNRNIKKSHKDSDNINKALNDTTELEAKSLVIANAFLTGKTDGIIDYNIDDFRNILKLIIRNSEHPFYYLNQLIHHKIHHQTPESYLSWFKDDLRSTIFLTSIIESQIAGLTFKGKSELINFLSDYIRYQAIELDGLIEPLRLQYAKQPSDKDSKQVANIQLIKSIYLNNKISERSIKWINVEDKEQIQWIYERLSQNKYILLEDIFFPINTFEMYAAILACLDKLSNLHSVDIESVKSDGSIEKKSILKRNSVLIPMRKAWETRQFREKNARKKVERVVSIYEKNYDKLLKLSKNKETTPDKMLNEFIESEYKKASMDDSNKDT